MKVLKLLLVSLLTTSCILTPGIDEPVVLVYVLKSDGTGECYPKDVCPKQYLDYIDMIGYQCVSPNGASKINSHHEILHRELNKDRND